MQPEIDIGPLTLQTFGLCLAAGFVFAGVMVWKRLEEWGKPGDWAYEMAFAAAFGGILGSRIYFIVENYSDVKDDLLGNFFSGAGLVWYGGLIGGAIGVLLWARYRGMLNLRLLDLAAVPLALGYAVGRIGCQLSGDGDYGQPWDGPWAMAYPDGAVPTDVPVHPTPIYEATAMSLLAYALWRLRDRYQPGILFALYLLGAGIERFLVEFIRRNDDVLLGLTQAQVLSVAMMLAGGIWIARARANGKLYADAPAEAGTPAHT